MQNFPISHDEKPLNFRSKSRKNIKKAQNPILDPSCSDLIPISNLNANLSSKKPVYATISNQSPESLSSSETFTSKIKYLSEENQNLLSIVNSNQKEIDFLNSLLLNFLDFNEILKIKQKSEYNDQEKNWKIPNFIVQHKKTIFPKLQKAQIKEAIQKEIKQRKIVFNGEALMPQENEENKINCRELFNDIQIRPATSAAKYRQRSSNQKREFEEDHRKSPMIRKTKFQ